jgi:hypothetical protein
LSYYEGGLSLRCGVSLEIAVTGYLDWPFHVSSSARMEPIVNSWCFVESWTPNQELLEHYLRAHQQLHGRYPSLGRLLAGAHIENQVLVLAPP